MLKWIKSLFASKLVKPVVTVQPKIDVHIEADRQEWRFATAAHRPKMTWAELVENNRKVNGYFERKHNVAV